MRLFLHSSLLLSTLLLAATALAQPRSLRGRVPPGREVAPGQQKQNCAVRRAIVAQEEQRLNAASAELAGIDTELAQLQRRIDELKRRRSDVTRLVSAYDTRYRAADRAYKAECAADDSCEQYDTMVDELDRQGNVIQGDLNNIRTEIEASQREMVTLRGRIEPLQREYGEKRCNNLVPGETAQETIDRCSVIFSEWNRLQATLNQYNSRLPLLRSTYQQQLSSLASIETRAAQYQAHMERNCSTSQRVVVLRSYGKGGGVRQRAEDLGRQLDELANEVTKLRGIRITVEPTK